MTVDYTHIPPLLIEIDDRWYLEVVHGSKLVRAPIDDGAYFLEQVVEKLAAPAMRMRTQGLRVPARSSD